MALALTVVRYLNLALFLFLALASLRKWRKEESTGAAWSAGAFGLLAGTVALGTFLPQHPHGFSLWLTKFVVIGLVLFPYVLYRFMTAFNSTSRGLDRFAFGFTALIVFWTLLLPRFPAQGEPRSHAFTLYLVLFLVHWSLFSLLAAYRLWRAGAGHPTAAKRRMHLISLGALGMTIALILTAAPSGNDLYHLVVQLMASVATVLFFLGVAPPAVLRLIWRRNETGKIQAAIRALFEPTAKEEISAQMLPHIAGIVGARAVDLTDADGVRLGEYRAATREVEADAVPRVIPLPGGGALRVWTSALTPFFGEEELGALNSMAVFIALALERAATLERERLAVQRLEEANSLKDTLLSAVSHELRTPLTSVLGFALTLRSRGRTLGPEQTDQMLDELVAGARRLDSLLSDLLDLDRLSRGVLEPRYEAIDLAELVTQTVAGMKLEIQPELEVESVQAEVDVAKLERIVENLVYNAFKHTPPGTRVQVGVVSQDDGAEITVADNGPGVPERLRESIFEPFNRGDTLNNHSPGTGIGLSLVSRFAALQGGRVWVDDREGGGAVFHVWLPARIR
jgi:signal transduction histidine kinase